MNLAAEVARPETPSRSLRRIGLATGAVIVLVALGIVVTWPLALGLLVDAMGLGGPPVHPPLPDKPSIAVLPFENMSGDPEQEYFSDGIAKDLITRLSSWRQFPVIARNSTFTYKGQAVDVQKVGRELGARYVVEGSVRRAGGRVRISAQLIDATTGHHVWAERYDRELRDIFVVQDEITESIVGSIAPALVPTEEARAARTEQLAESGRVYLSAETARLVEGYFELEDLGAFPVKGVSDPVGLFEPKGPGPYQTRFDRARARGLTRFVGRDVDMQALEAANGAGTRSRDAQDVR